MVKNCSNVNCRQINPQSLENFYKNLSTKDAHTSRCKVCIKEEQKRYSATSEAKIKVSKRKKTERYKQRERKYWANPQVRDRHENNRLLREYGISLNQYNDMIIEQNHKCKLCGIDEINAGQKGLVIDHNHKTGKLRGLICGPCNRALGYFKDSLEILHKAIDYLNKDDNKSNIIIFESKKMETK